MQHRSPITPLKRPHPGSSAPALPPNERKLYQLIKSKESMGIWTADIKKEPDFRIPTVMNKTLKSLVAKNLIKQVADVKNKSKKVYMAVEFEPAKEISGGTWYQDGQLDVEYINILTKSCLNHVELFKVATVEMIWRKVQDSGVLTVEVSMQHIVDILRTLVLDKKLEESTSTGKGDFIRVPAGTICYRSSKSRDNSSSKVAYLTEVPCGVCPRINECTPDGIISPVNCVYFKRWLGLEF